jgi:NAD(P)-dependent dehydrogenase (short-subunit alcohol dehydrogenase family)
MTTISMKSVLVTGAGKGVRRGLVDRLVAALCLAAADARLGEGRVPRRRRSRREPSLGGPWADLGGPWVTPAGA